MRKFFSSIIINKIIIHPLKLGFMFYALGLFSLTKKKKKKKWNEENIAFVIFFVDIQKALTLNHWTLL